MSGRGGTREGSGRKKGGVNRLSLEAVEKAKQTGELPHEFLLRVSRGETITTGKEVYTPTFKDRVHAAEAAAPYFAHKLAAVEHSGNVSITPVLNYKRKSS